MGKLYQITDDDLSVMERDLPALADALMPHLTPALKVKVRRVKSILSNVRWNYGPLNEVETIPTDDGPDHCS